MKTAKWTTSTHVEVESNSHLGTLFHNVLQDAEYDLMSLNKQTLGFGIHFKL